MGTVTRSSIVNSIDLSQVITIFHQTMNRSYSFKRWIFFILSVSILSIQIGYGYTDPPPTCNAQNIIAYLDANGSVNVLASDVDNGSTSTSGYVSFSLSENQFDCSDLGANLVTLTVSDSYYNTSSCSAIVTVLDTLAPVCSMNNPTVALNQLGEVTLVSSYFNIIDNCSIDQVSFDRDYFDCSDIGMQPVELTIQDISGNISICLDTINIVDNGTLTCPVDADIIIQLPSETCETVVNFSLPLGIDNCNSNISSIAIPGEPQSGDIFPIGTTTIQYYTTDNLGNNIICSFNVIVEPFDSGVIACKNVNISVDGDCSINLHPSIFLASETYSCEEQYQIVVWDEDGNIVPDSLIGYAYIDQFMQYELCFLPTGNCCWGNFTLEDKLAPTIVCPDSAYVISCFEVDDFVPEIAMDNCSYYTDLHLLYEYVDHHFCDSLYKEKILRTYQVVDGNGATSEPCTIELLVERVNLGLVVFPNDTVTQIYCDAYYETNDDGFPLPYSTTGSGSGVPTYPVYSDLDTTYVPIYPVAPDHLCETYVHYTDQEIVQNNCKTKIMRTWQVQEWHCTGEQSYGAIQFIEIVDHNKPTIVPLPDMTVSTNGHACDAHFYLPSITAYDACSDEFVVDIDYPGGFIDDANGGLAHLPVGIHQVVYTVSDGCYNEATDTLNVTVKDLTKPTAVCEQFTVVSIPFDGLTDVYAEVLDDGSNDECGLKGFLARRMDNDNCECSYPIYDDMTKLGKYNGHLYYISDYAIDAHKAHKFAQSMGGDLISINDTLEQDWIFNEASDYFDDHSYFGNIDRQFWIGLHNTNHANYYEWYNDDQVDYQNWAPYEPYGHGNNVLVTSDGQWSDYDGHIPKHFVVELPDTCSFSKKVQFCCADVGTEQMVVVRAIDQSGNFNECMVSIKLQDKIAPIMNCIPDATISCSDGYNINDLSFDFGMPEVSDNCNQTQDIVEEVEEEMSPCNSGKIIRTFKIYDADSNVISQCQQKIYIEAYEPYNMDSIIWPLDYFSESECQIEDLTPYDLDTLYSFPRYYEGPCDLIGYNYDDQVFQFIPGNDACIKILRTWSLINWCKVLPNGDYEVETYEQVIKVYNEIDPMIQSGCTNMDTFVSIAGDCGLVPFNVAATATDDCTPTNLLDWKFELDISADGDIDSIGYTSNFAWELPVGDHSITWTVLDKCGNVDACSNTFTLINQKAPTPVCINGLSVDLTPMDLDNDGVIDTAMTVLWASDFDAKSYHSCGYDVVLSFSPDTADKLLELGCDDIGMVTVELWATDLTYLQQDYCVTFVDVTDNNPDSPCTETPSVGGNSQSREIAGNIFRPGTMESIQNVQVNLTGDVQSQIMTEEDGSYAFPNIPIEQDYIISPLRDGDDLNGVTTLDLVLIQKHIIGALTLDSPYKLLAADANNSQSITAADLIEIRKLILGVIPAFSQTDSWNFIDMDYAFLDETNPWLEPLPMSYSIDGLVNNMNVDFFGIKIADVDQSSTLSLQSDHNIENRNRQTLQYDINNEMVSIYMDCPNIHGLQISLLLDANDVQVLSEQIDIEKAHYHFLDGILNISWNSLDVTDIDPALPLFNIVTDNIMSEVTLTNQGLNNEYYDENLDIVNLNLLSKHTADWIDIKVNPNPWSQSSSLIIDVDESKLALLKVRSIDGKTLMRRELLLDAGYNDIEITADDIKVNGILIFEVLIDGEIHTKRSLKVR